MRPNRGGPVQVLYEFAQRLGDGPLAWEEIVPPGRPAPIPQGGIRVDTAQLNG